MTTEHHQPLKVSDRCDTGACGAQAFVRVHFQSGALDYCAHHWVASELDVFTAAPYAVVQDERHKINSKPDGLSPTSDGDGLGAGYHAQ